MNTAPTRTTALRLLLLALAAALALAGPAAAESPRSGSAPTIAGTATVGSTLTGGNGSWLFLDGSSCTDCTFAFQWTRGTAAASSFVNIAGATAQTYVVTSADAGSTLRVNVTASRYDCNALGTDCRTVSVAASSAPTAAVPGTAPAPPPPSATAPTSTVAPAVGGIPREDQSLAAVSGGWTGSAPMSFTYQWQRCDAYGAGCAALADASESIYTLASEDVGHTLRVLVTAKNSAGTRSATSAATQLIEAAPKVPPRNNSPLVITGSAQVGGLLSSRNGSWYGPAPIAYTFQWRRCNASGGSCVDIAGATGETYRPVAADVRHTLRFVVTAENKGGKATATSLPTLVIHAKPKPKPKAKHK